MASRRNRPTLYEVVHHQRKELVKRRAATPVAQPPGAASAPPALDRPTLATPTQSATLSHTVTHVPAAKPAVREASAPPAASNVRWFDGVLEFQLSAPGLIVGVIALSAVFGLGLYSGNRMADVAANGDPRDNLALLTAHPSDAARAIAEVQSTAEANRDIQPPKPRTAVPVPSSEPVSRIPGQAIVQPSDAEVVPQPPVHNPAGAVATPPRPAAQEMDWAPGKYYIVVQHFPADAPKPADGAQQYLAQNGVNTVLLRGSDIRLIVTQPFDSKEAAGGAIASLKKLGQSYAESGYRFSDCYVRLFKRAR